MTLATSTLGLTSSGDPADDRLETLIAQRSRSLQSASYIEHARDGRSVSFRDLASGVATRMALLEQSGVRAGATVGLVISDPLVFSEMFLATIASGRWAAALNPETPVQGSGGLAAALTRVDAAVVLADHTMPTGIEVDWRELTDPDRRGDDARLGSTPDAGVEPSGGAVLASSGTTGAPKVIRLGQSQLLHTARSVAAHHELTPQDRGFNSLPLFHINAEVVGLLSALVAGSCLVLDDKFHRTQFWDLMDRCRITWINAVPAIISRLAEPKPDEAIPSAIRFVRSASAPLPASTLAQFEANTGLPVLETYGMTEAASQITANPLRGTRKPGSVGLPVGIELRIVPDDTAQEESPVDAQGGVIGHVEIRGPSVISAYGGDLHQDKFDANGWLRTGDLGHFDDDGYLYLDARSDDVINRGGEKVFPREIEELILTEPDVTAACVVGDPDPVFGQVPVAYVVLGGADPVGTPDVVDRIRLHLESALVRSKRPVAILVVAELPAGANGKVQRRTLREGGVPVLYRRECR